VLTLPPPPTARVNDYAGVLSAADRARLEQQLTERERATGAQMVIAIFPSLEGESLEDVSIRLAERWKVGRKGVDNGVILLAFLKERKLRIEVGYGLEPVITDAVASAMIRDVIAPRFREGRYTAGLEAAVNEVFARIGAETTTRDTARGPAARRAVDPGTMLLLLLIFGVFGVELVLVEVAFILVELVVGELVRFLHDDRAVPLREGVLFPLGDVGRRHLGGRPVRAQGVPDALGQGDLHRVDPDRAPEFLDLVRALGPGVLGRGLVRVACSGGLTGHEDLRKGCGIVRHTP